MIILIHYDRHGGSRRPSRIIVLRTFVVLLFVVVHVLYLPLDLLSSAGQRPYRKMGNSQCRGVARIQRKTLCSQGLLTDCASMLQCVHLDATREAHVSKYCSARRQVGWDSQWQ